MLSMVRGTRTFFIWMSNESNEGMRVAVKSILTANIGSRGKTLFARRSLCAISLTMASTIRLAHDPISSFITNFVMHQANIIIEKNPFHTAPGNCHLH
jgi:hypothetical protein